jgi:hypothetical protein
LLQASKSKDKDGDESTQRKVKEAQKEELDRQNKLQTNMALKAALGGGARWQNFGKAKAAGAAAATFSCDVVHKHTLFTILVLCWTQIQSTTRCHSLSCSGVLGNTSHVADELFTLEHILVLILAHQDPAPFLPLLLSIESMYSQCTGFSVQGQSHLQLKLLLLLPLQHLRPASLRSQVLQKLRP